MTGAIVNHEEHLLELERRWMTAVQSRDCDVLRQVLAEDFTLTSWASGGEVLSRADYLADVQAVQVDKFDLHTCSVQVFADAAVVKCHLELTARINERPWHAQFLISDFWIRRNGRWCVVSRHASLAGEGADRCAE